MASGMMRGMTNQPSASSTAAITPGHSRSGFREAGLSDCAKISGVDSSDCAMAMRQIRSSTVRLFPGFFGRDSTLLQDARQDDMGTSSVQAFFLSAHDRIQRSPRLQQQEHALRV